MIDTINMATYRQSIIRRHQMGKSLQKCVQLGYTLPQLVDFKKIELLKRISFDFVRSTRMYEMRCTEPRDI